MSQEQASDDQSSDADDHWLGIGRAVGGAVLFSLPLLMTMEMWWIAYYLPSLNLASLLIVSIPLFYGVSTVIGFRSGSSVMDNLIDVFAAYAFGFAISFIILFLFNSVSGSLAAGANFTVVALMAIPASLGALLGRSELGKGEHDPTSQKSYRDELVVLATGALFLALAVAPTEEIVLISHQMSGWHTLGLFVVTLIIMLAFAIGCSYSLSEGPLGRFVTIPSLINFCGTVFLISLLISLFLLWVFGHADEMQLTELIPMLVTLLFPAGVGAAAAKLII